MTLRLAVAAQRDGSIEVGEVRLLRMNDARTTVADSSIYRIRPADGPRWGAPPPGYFLWLRFFIRCVVLRALSQTYGYEALAFTTSGSA